MTNDGKISDYITFPKTFEKYKWYKPILVLIITLIIILILQALLSVLFNIIMGTDFLKIAMKGGYEAFTSPMVLLYIDLMIVIHIPSLYLASKIVKDRPFSSYSSSRGGWNYKLYFKALIIPIIIYLIYMSISVAIKGPEGTSHFSIAYLIIIFTIIPLQCIAEEYMFRGLIMQTLGSWLKKPVLALALQAIIFALSHGYNSLGLFETFVLGLVYGFFAWKTNGIEVSSALHTANNFCLGLFVMLGLQAPTSTPQLSNVIETIIFIIILGVIMYYVGKKTEWFGEVSENP